MTELIPEGYISLSQAFFEFRRKQGDLPEKASSIFSGERDEEEEASIDEQARHFAGLLSVGKLEVLVRIGNANCQVPSLYWLMDENAAAAFLGSPLRADPGIGNWSEIDGRTPFVSRTAFDAWLKKTTKKRQRSPTLASERKSCQRWLEEVFVQYPDAPFSNKKLWRLVHRRWPTMSERQYLEARKDALNGVAKDIRKAWSSAGPKNHRNK